jgi:proteasome assembly chaperone (PAC2) family protein
VRWGERPTLRHPVLVTAFEGWNDAGDAATAAVSYLHEQWEAHTFADIDPEDFYDFTVTRPRVELDAGDVRRIIWPDNRFSATAVPGTQRDVVLFRGIEPQLRWRTFCAQVVSVAEAVGAELVVTLGALLAEVPHSRPTSVFGTAYDDTVIADLGLDPSGYEGPTGIVGVLHAACQEAGLRSASLWAAVPTYVPGAPSPKAALSLVERMALLLETDVETSPLEGAAASYEAQVSELVAEDDETTEYVEALEQRYDDDAVGDPEALVEQVERFLRDNPDNDT